MLVFVPLDHAGLTRWAETGAHLPRSVFAVTEPMCDAFGFGATDDEGAEHTALQIAGLVSLLVTDRRLVAVAHTPAQPVAGAEFGEVRVEGPLSFTTVVSLFGEDATPATAALHRRLSGVTLTAAWDDAAVADFLAGHELLWHGPDEWRQLGASTMA